MKASLVLLFAVGFVVCAHYSSAAEPVKLYVSEVEVPSTSAKPLKMRFEEIERAPRYSVVQVTHSGGASVPSIMFVVRGMWEIARIRGTPFFIKLREWTPEDGKWLYKVGFAPDDQVDVRSYFGEALSESKFFSVKDYDAMFGK